MSLFNSLNALIASEFRGKVVVLSNGFIFSISHKKQRALMLYAVSEHLLDEEVLVMDEVSQDPVAPHHCLSYIHER